ncbi:MAG: carboxylesterase/lipase family protein [Lachnospiraceae bacterium]|nr:carboxylesterase/lipase family protein [Lachnospiraceae bacterium]
MAEYIVKTTSGEVHGYERDGRIDYLGIPYAEAPVGPLRFKRAVPKTPWEGTFDAKEYGNSPVQYNHGQVMGDEDCLTVNCQRPLTGDKLPVFVWIYGGGYNTGESSDEMYRGEAFVRDGVLFFSFNYRTNILGFYDFTTYPGCEDFDSNCGLSDQILALNWIRDNVEAFGGDPDRITIAGESAGGASVVNMLACPGVKGCFTQAIVESGLPNCMMTHRTARENIDLFLEGMHWTKKDMAQHLKNDDPHMFLPGHEYVQARHQYKNPGMFLPGPVQDDLMPVRPIDAIRGGSAEGISLIIGTNMHEGTMFVHPENTGFPNSWSMITEMMEKNGNADRLPQIVTYYHEKGKDTFTLFHDTAVSMASSIPPVTKDARQIGGDPFIRFATDYAFEMPAVKVAAAQRKYTENVWMYRYELVTKTGIETGWKASHAFELPFVFEKPDHPFSHFELDGEPADLFDKMCSSIHGDWVRFIKTGDPNPDWSRFEGADSPVRIYDRHTRTERLDRSHLMEVWGDMRFYEN